MHILHPELGEKMNALQFRQVSLKESLPQIIHD
jgi:hypothetical protein